MDTCGCGVQLLSFPCGVIRGALANLGVACTVTAESVGLPQSKHNLVQVKTYICSLLTCHVFARYIPDQDGEMKHPQLGSTRWPRGARGSGGVRVSVCGRVASLERIG